MHLEVDRDFLQWVGDVLICLDLELVLELFIRKPSIHLNHLCDDGRPETATTADLQPVLAAAATRCRGLTDTLKFGDVLFDDGIRWQRLDGISLDAVPITRST